ncbi:MAG: hypothetical protein A3G24_16245 [Betaproteobacteria bacterium RIFCSPLOWO2_12_FULL_62_13]|nr:MAG: hypothetical protein A3G24_16245 [Betaproteobacteria bacterium RIFCSPLOWO2_12_FULL_62_13]
MLRASAVCEKAGVPSSTLVCEGFLRQAAAASVGLGMPNIPVARVPGHTNVQTKEELRRNILDVTVNHVIENLTRVPAAATRQDEPSARDIVYEGGFDAVNQFFYENEWSDGLPIVPPTRQKIEAFLRCTGRAADESLGILLPDSRAASIWSIAVNGVMAGCRPEYMPLLVALVEAMADPHYGIEHSGNTPGGETLIILNGPIIKELGFNYTQGVMRDGFLPNTSIGRFWRLYLRNVAGFVLHKNDKATYGNTWRVVVAENEEVLTQIGWQSLGVDMGHAAGQNTVTIARYTGGNVIVSVSGGVREQILPYIADAVVRQISWQLMFAVGQGMGKLRPLVLLTPILAETIAKAGLSKADLKQYLFEHARLPASQFERILRDWTLKPTWDLAAEARLGKIPGIYHESDDPDRMVPLVWKPDDYMIAVTGDPLRNNAYVFAHNGLRGYPVSKPVRLPKDWDRRLAVLRAST